MNSRPLSHPDPGRPAGLHLARTLALAPILLAATALRLYRLGTPSLWYDEVVSMRLARADGPTALIRLLDQIDATRAPLHPLLLQGWLGLFGPSDFAGRSFSALCGILTVAALYWLGRALFDDRTGLWAAGLGAISPLLVQYSQEVRMYAWLVLVASLNWLALLALRTSASRGRMAALGVGQVALVYSHPLGLLMVGAQAVAYLLERRSFRLSIGRWALIQVVVALAVAPWVGRYFDHEPESTSGRLPIRFLLGLPIGFTGGDSLTLLVGLAIVVRGALGRGAEGGRARVILDRPVETRLLGIWLTLPPIVLYAYSYAAHPIFGPARYTLFVGPAYLLLLARGLVKLPAALRPAAVLAVVLVAVPMLRAQVYAPDLKADWRAAAAWLRPEATEAVVVLSADPGHNVEAETARYHLGPAYQVVEPSALQPTSGEARWLVVAVGLRGGRMVAPIPARIAERTEAAWVRDFPGLRLIGVRPDRDRGSGA